MCPTVSPSATSDELKILSVCHTHVNSVPHANEAPYTCVLPVIVLSIQRYGQKLELIHSHADIQYINI